MIQDHSESFRVWAEAKVNSRIIVHVDAHSDFRRVEDSAMSEIGSLLRAGRVADIMARADVGTGELMNLGNYLYPAAREGIARRIIWVVEGLPEGPDVVEFVKSKLIREGQPADEVRATFTFVQGRAAGTLYGIPFEVCSARHLPRIDEPVLLDVDSDYFVDLVRIEPDHRLFDQIDAFRDRLVRAGLHWDIATVATSFNLGFTPVDDLDLPAAVARMLRGGLAPLDGTDWNFYARRAEADRAWRLGDADQALAIASALLRDRPGDPAASFLSARIRVASGDVGGAVALAEQAAKSDPVYARALADLGWSLEEHDPKTAEQLLDLAERFAPGAAFVREKRADILFNRGRYEEALALYRSLRNRGFIIVMYTGDTLMKLKRWDEGLAMYETGFEMMRHSSLLQPAQASLSYLLLGDYWANVRKDKTRARGYLGTYLGIPRSDPDAANAKRDVREILGE